MLSQMSLSELRAAAKSAGVPSSGNKSVLLSRLDPTSTTTARAKSSLRTSPGIGNTSAQAVRVPMQFNAGMLKTLNLRLTGVSTDASGQPEYIYMPCTAAPAPGPLAKTIAKKAAANKTTSKTSLAKSSAEVSDEALDEAIGCFVERLDEKKVPVELCRQMLKHFVDESDIPKQKMKVYELLAEQSHLETDDEASDEEDDDDDESAEEDDDDCEDGA